MVVVRQVVLSPARMKGFKKLTEEAIQRAIQAAKVRIRDAAIRLTPVWSGRLQQSFDIASTPRSIVFKWDAMSDDGFVYAKVVDEGRTGGTVLTPKTKEYMKFKWPWKGGKYHFRKKTVQGGFAGRHYADKVKAEAVKIILDELARELTAIGGP